VLLRRISGSTQSCDVEGEEHLARHPLLSLTSPANMNLEELDTLGG
jgi:hypothetical protein